MLRKLKIAAIVAAAIEFVRSYFGIELPVPDGFPEMVEALVNALVAIIPVLLAWFVREPQANIARLKTKG